MASTMHHRSRSALVRCAALLSLVLLPAAAASGHADGSGPVHISAAPGDVIAGYKDQFHLQAGANQQVPVASLNLPAGGFTIVAKAYTTIPLPSGLVRTIRCVLSAGGDFDQIVTNHDGNIAGVLIVLNVNHIFATPGQALLSCGYLFTSGDTFLGFIKLTAIAAGNVSNVVLP